jgi:hypothetical protein
MFTFFHIYSNVCVAIQGVGGLPSFQWPEDPVHGIEPVCDYMPCFDPLRGDYTTSPLCCAGHLASSRLFDLGDDTFQASGQAHIDASHMSVQSSSQRVRKATPGMKEFGPTNQQIMIDVDASSESSYVVSYVYDNFRWDHCEEDFEGQLMSIRDKSGR